MARCAFGNSAVQPPARTIVSMQLKTLKIVLASVWISAMLIAGLVGQLNSVSSWALLAAVALLPPIVVMRRWNTPAQTMSESIREARR